MFELFSKFIAILLIGIVVSSTNASATGGRLINGLNAEAQHAFAIRIHSVIDNASEHAYLSSGVAVSSTVVVTVAQAIKSYSIWFVFSGGVISAAQVFQESRNSVAHPDFSPTTLNNNIGVIILTTPVDNFIPVAVPGGSFGIYQVFGYGVDADNQLPTILQTSPVTLITNEECANIYGNALVTDNNFCGMPLQDGGQAANGDQGGPLIPVVVAAAATGIVSFWGRDATLPVVFERVNAYNDFLADFL